jgi:hypothetical protein
MITDFAIHGKRQRERAQMVINHINDQEHARWQDPSTQRVLLLEDLAQQDALLQWVQDETLWAGTRVRLVVYRQDCDCPGGYTEWGTKRCQGHEKTLVPEFSGYHLRWYLDEYRNDRNCNGVVGYLNSVRIGCV